MLAADIVQHYRYTITSHDGLKLTGRYYHVSDGGPLEIQCHGYKGNPFVDFAGAWRIAKEAGRNVLLINQRCHGGSEGHTITFGILEKQDVMAWITYANNRFGKIPMLLNGVSMGAATVLMVAGMELPENVKGIIADCPYDAPANIIKKVLGQDKRWRRRTKSKNITQLKPSSWNHLRPRIQRGI